MGNYYVYPGVSMMPRAVQGLGTANDTAAAAGGIATTTVLVTVGMKVLEVAAGYYLGSFFGHKWLGAALGGVFGLWGIAGLAFFSDNPPSALPNRRRRRYRRRGHGRRR